MQLTERQTELAQKLLLGDGNGTVKPKLEELADILQRTWEPPQPADMKALTAGGIVARDSDAIDYVRSIIERFVAARNAAILKAREPDKRVEAAVKVLRQSYMKRCMGEVPDYESLAEDVLRTVDAISA